jgi:hypothetical protein
MSFNLSYEKIVIHNDSDNTNDVIRRVVLSNETNPELGHFTIEGKGYDEFEECFDSGNTCSMTISLDDEIQGKGLSRIMIEHMVENIKLDYPRIRGDQMLFIDGDGSGGFWGHIGMKPHRYGYDYRGGREYEGKGYEKMLTFQDLVNFVNNSKKGKGRKTKGNKPRKYNKTNKNKRQEKHVKTFYNNYVKRYPKKCEFNS